MKLQSKYTAATISAAIFVLILAGIAYYFLIRNALINQVDEALKVEEQEIVHHIRVFKKLPAESQFRDQRIAFIKSGAAIPRQFITRNVFSPMENEKEISRQLIFPVTVNGIMYKAVVTKSQVEAEELLFLILFITSLVIVLLAIILFVANRVMMKKLWRPFYSTLSAMKEFNLSTRKDVNLVKTDTDEFAELNEACRQMTKKINSDYELLKSFADNASHEMQTPLAIINSKLDLLIQDQNLQERTMQHVQAMYDAVGKLTKLNHSLLLLNKIENDQFTDKKNIKIDALLKERLSHLEELIQSKQLHVSAEFGNLDILMNPMLADILINNLLINSIRHNKFSGDIFIKTGSDSVTFSNTGSLEPLDENLIFNRFEKRKDSDGTGLGLAIVKQICDLNHLGIKYSFENGIHSFKIMVQQNSNRDATAE